MPVRPRSLIHAKGGAVKSASAQKKHYGEELVGFFEDHLVSHADALYRLGFALTLSLDGAAQLTMRTYQVAADDLERFHSKGEAAGLALLVGQMWRCFKELGNSRFQEGQSAVIKALKPMSIEGRTALVAVDVVGLSVSEAARAFGASETEVRSALAGARRALMMTTLS